MNSVVWLEQMYSGSGAPSPPTLLRGSQIVSLSIIRLSRPLAWCNFGCANGAVWRYRGWVGGFRGGLRPPHLPGGSMGQAPPSAGHADWNHAYSMLCIAMATSANPRWKRSSPSIPRRRARSSPRRGRNCCSKPSCGASSTVVGGSTASMGSVDGAPTSASSGATRVGCSAA